MPVGRQRRETDSARRIVRILDRTVADLTAEDFGHVKKSNGYFSRHLSRTPDRAGDRRELRYDPMKRALVTS